MFVPKILIVDDTPSNLVALTSALREVKARLVPARSGEEALAATLDHEFTLAILDVKMPGMDGFELAELLRGDPGTRYLPIIFLSAFYREARQIFRGYETGAVDYILKPYNPAILAAKVRVLLAMEEQRAELERHRRRLTEANAELEGYAFLISNDLRAPLRAVLGLSRGVLEDESLSDDTRADLQRVYDEAERMRGLVDELLALSRLGKVEPEPEPLDLGELARGINKGLARRNPERDVEVTIDGPLSAHGDLELVRKALEELLRNAWKFTRDVHPARIEVGEARRDGRRVFFVRDNGVGFDMRYADRLFVPFQRLHRQADFPGTGIGLATVRRIVGLHDGVIWAESEPGRGTVVWFSLSNTAPDAG